MCVLVVDANSLHVLMAAGGSYKEKRIEKRWPCVPFPDECVKLDIDIDKQVKKKRVIVMYTGGAGVRKTGVKKYSWEAAWMVGSIVKRLDVDSREVKEESYTVLCGLVLNRYEKADRNEDRWVLCTRCGVDDVKDLHLIPVENIYEVQEPAASGDVPRGYLQVHKDIAECIKRNKDKEESEVGGGA